MSKRLIAAMVIVVMLLVTSGIAFAVTGRGHDGPSSGAVTVPQLVGMQLRPVQELLAERGLRWTFVGTERVWSKPPPANQWSTGDDDFVVEQSPRAGATIEGGGVVRLRTSCTMAKLPPGVVCID
jgi:beta-lactam-binding protein with PASTA domain